MNINPKVVDLSHYDDVSDWRAVKAFGIVGAVNKATQGRGMVDKTYASRRQSALDAGLLYGAYHFLDGSNPEQQAAHFLEVVNPDQRDLLALDHETTTVPLVNARRFLEFINSKIGRYPLLYSYASMLAVQFSGHPDAAYWAQVPLWLAHYTTAPSWPHVWAKPKLWQFTGDGNGPGPHQVPGIHIAGGCDINSFDGTDDELRAFWLGLTVDEAKQAPQAADPPQPPAAAAASARQTDIVATCFGGRGDENASAYGGRVDPNVLGVALPFHFPGQRSKVAVFRGGRVAACAVVDVGPHNTNDPYWCRPGARPLAESQHGNKAGIDMTPAVFAALGISPRDPEYGLTKVDWEFVA